MNDVLFLLLLKPPLERFFDEIFIDTQNSKIKAKSPEKRISERPCYMKIDFYAEKCILFLFILNQQFVSDSFSFSCSSIQKIIFKKLR